MNKIENLGVEQVIGEAVDFIRRSSSEKSLTEAGQILIEQRRRAEDQKKKEREEATLAGTGVVSLFGVIRDDRVVEGKDGALAEISLDGNYMRLKFGRPHSSEEFYIVATMKGESLIVKGRKSMKVGRLKLGEAVWRALKSPAVIRNSGSGEYDYAFCGDY